MSIASDVQSLTPGAVIELFVLDTTMFTGGSVSRFHAGTNGLRQPIIWQGQSYEPWPIMARGFDRTGAGRLPRPTMSVSNVFGTIGALTRDFGDLLGAQVTRKRTFARYLDAANFPGGVNPSANPSEFFPDDVFYIDQKTSENKHMVEFTLAAQMDLSTVRIPLRVMTQTCGWQYRGEGCGYAGPPVADEMDEPTSIPAQDRCGKRLSSCKLRFGGTSSTVLPFGGFPALGMFR